MNDDKTNVPGSDAETREVPGPNAAPTVQQIPSTEQKTDVPGQETLEDKIRRRISAHDESEPTAKREDPLIGREIANRFNITSKIGAGGMGAVYKARQRGMDRDVAIKVLLRELTENETVLRRFHIEALAVSKLRHPNTIQIFDFGETDDGLLYIAMEYLQGKPLQRVLRQEQQLSAKRALKITAQMAKSLREAHAKGIVHRDLKPDNIILESVGGDHDFVKVLDFGVAKLAEGDGDQKTLTKAGSIFGTPKYMSPEQSRGGDIDGRSDVYSIGILLYEMLVGRVPFNAENPLGILIKHLQESPPEFQAIRPDIVVPVEVEEFVLRLLAKDPANRPQTAEAVILEAEALLEALPELYRSVVTRADAEAAGIEISSPSRTSMDTLMRPLEDTVGTFGDATVLGVQDRPKRRRWPLVALATLVVLLGTAGGIYASLEPLPRDYLAITSLEGMEIGSVPVFDVDSVVLIIKGKQSDIEMVDAVGNVVGMLEQRVRRSKDAKAERYIFRKEGFHDYERDFTFADDDSVTIDLKPIIKEVVTAPVGVRPVTSTKPSTTSTTPAGEFNPTKLPETKTAPAEFNPTKLKETKHNPFGGGGGGAKAKDPKKKPSPF